jgi:SAM-dependent methyltransferase
VYQCEAGVADGLEELARAELLGRFGGAVHADRARPNGTLVFDYSGDLGALLTLKTVLSVAIVRHYPVPRPRALLGDQHFRALLAQIAAARALAPADAYETLYISAAGSDSSVMARLKGELARETGLTPVPPDAHEGDLLLRLRRSHRDPNGWEALVRLSPRPLSARPWRVCNREGALNATVARAMVLMAAPTAEERALNLGCGSGTLLVEHADHLPGSIIAGCDTDPAALDCSHANAFASGHSDRIDLYDWDARSLPIPDASVGVVYADLPFGHLVGTHANNLELYPAIIKEASRVAEPGARCALISHEIRLLDSILRDSTDWAVEREQRVSLGGLHPRIFLLRRNDGD